MSKIGVHIDERNPSMPVYSLTFLTVDHIIALFVYKCMCKIKSLIFDFICSQKLPKISIREYNSPVSFN